MDVVVVADTHLRQGWEKVPDQLVAALARADVVLHAGDLVSRRALAELEEIACRVHVVLGNNDHELRGMLPESLVLDLEGVNVALVHETGPRKGREARVGRRFPSADLIVFGHSHVPLSEVGLEGQRLFNPGSPTQRRAQPHRTYGRLRLSGGRIELAAIEALED